MWKIQLSVDWTCLSYGICGLPTEYRILTLEREPTEHEATQTGDQASLYYISLCHFWCWNFRQKVCVIHRWGSFSQMSGEKHWGKSQIMQFSAQIGKMDEVVQGFVELGSHPRAPTLARPEKKVLALHVHVWNRVLEVQHFPKTSPHISISKSTQNLTLFFMKNKWHDFLGSQYQSISLTGRTANLPVIGFVLFNRNWSIDLFDLTLIQNAWNVSANNNSPLSPRWSPITTNKHQELFVSCCEVHVQELLSIPDPTFSFAWCVFLGVGGIFAFSLSALSTTTKSANFRNGVLKNHKGQEWTSPTQFLGGCNARVG